MGIGFAGFGNCTTRGRDRNKAAPNTVCRGGQPPRIRTAPLSHTSFNRLQEEIRMNKEQTKKSDAGSRRKFLAGAVAATTGAATLGFPMIAKAQTGPITMRWQSTWPSKDIFHEYALD